MRSFAADRRCPLSLALCAGAYWLGDAERSVRRLRGPFPVAVVPVSTSHRVSVPTHDGYSSRSSPCSDVAGWLGEGPEGVKAPRRTPHRRARRPPVGRPQPPPTLPPRRGR